MSDIKKLGEKVKEWEQSTGIIIDPTLPVVIRIDGHRFSRFTKHFQRPFDDRFHQCMISTCHDLMQFFPRCRLSYTQSDEISLFFANFAEFKCRVQKIVSLSASYTSVRFDHHLRRICPYLHDQHGGTAHFDSRIFNVSTISDMYEVYQWRWMDAKRNGILNFGHQHLTKQQMHRSNQKNTLNQLNQKGFDYSQLVPIWAQGGTTLFKEKIEKECMNMKTKEVQVCDRSKIKIIEGIFHSIDEFEKVILADHQPVWSIINDQQ